MNRIPTFRPTPQRQAAPGFPLGRNRLSHPVFSGLESLAQPSDEVTHVKRHRPQWHGDVHRITRENAASKTKLFHEMIILLEHAFGDEAPPGYYLRQIDKTLNAGGSIFYTQVGAHVVSVAMLRPPKGNNEATVSCVATDIHHRQRGISRKIMETLIHEAQASHFPVLSLRTRNPDAFNFYKSLGFVEKALFDGKHSTPMRLDLRYKGLKLQDARTLPTTDFFAHPASKSVH